jgi:hypothetical protein
MNIAMANQKKNRDKLMVWRRNHYIKRKRGRRGRDRMIVGFKLPMRSVPITTNIVRSNSTQAMYSWYNLVHDLYFLLFGLVSSYIYKDTDKTLVIDICT